MRVGLVSCIIGLLASGSALAQSRDLPTPATPGSNPGATATDAIVSPTKPATVAPPTSGAAAGAPSPAPSSPPDKVAPPLPRSPASPAAPLAAGPRDDMRDLLEAARATAKATQDSVEYGRVVPDILTQILAKLDKLENKLDKVENAMKAAPRTRR